MRGSVVVTGASSGIGAATARLLAERGFRVFAGYRKPEDAGPLREVGAVPLRLDVTEEESVAAAREEVARGTTGRPLLGLVNNAGIPAAGPLELVPLEELRRALEVNAVGALATTQAFLPSLRENGGRVVMMSSVSGRLPMPFAGPYAASKFALEALSDSLRRELSAFGVDVVVIQPGAIRTAIWEKVEEMDLERYAGTPYAPMVEVTKRAALEAGQRGLSPERVAEAVLEALTAARPPVRRLVVPPTGALRIWLMERLPDRWLDRMIARRAWR